MTVQPVSFEEWWEQQGGDDGVSDRIGCEFFGLCKEAKDLFRECFLTGVALGLKELLTKGGEEK